jgi:hypothetical protein
MVIGLEYLEAAVPVAFIVHWDRDAGQHHHRHARLVQAITDIIHALFLGDF